MECNSAVKAFYESNYKEDDREEREPLEFMRSKSIIARYLTGGIYLVTMEQSLSKKH